MAKGQHPNIQRRDGDRPESISTVRALVHVLDPERIEWVEAELADERITLQITRSVAQLVSALVDDPPPRAQILVVDFDALTPADLVHLHQIRERGWFGAIVALGQVPGSLRSSLSIAHVLVPPLRRNSLRNTISRTGIALPTTKMPRVDG